MHLMDLMTPLGSIEGQSLPEFMNEWTGKTQPRVDPEVAARRAADLAWMEGVLQEDQDRAAMAETLKAKRAAMESGDRSRQRLAELGWQLEKGNG
jgi:hypothetical protein